MVFDQELTPRAVAKLSGSRGRVNDVRKQDGSEDALFICLLTAHRYGTQEAFELAEQPFLISPTGRKVRTWQCNEASTADVPGQVAGARLEANVAVGPVHDQRRDTDRRQNVAYVDVDVHSQVQGRRGRAMAEPGDPRLLEQFFVGRARDQALRTLGHGLKIAPSTVYSL